MKGFVMDDRLHGLDLLRALMMLLGIVLHGAQMYMTMELGFDYYVDSASSVLMDALLITINTFRMPLFFLLSGFFAAMIFSRRHLSGLVENRLRRIALPMLFFLPPLSVVLSVQWIIATNLTETGQLSLDTSLLKYPYLLWNNTHHLWFLYYLLIILSVTCAATMLWSRLPSSVVEPATRVLKRLPIMGSGALVVIGLMFGAMAYHRSVGRLGGNIIWEPYWPSVGFFGVCTLLGWGLYYRQALLSVFVKRSWGYLAVALLCLVVALWAFLAQGEAGGNAYATHHPVLVFANGLSVSFFMAAFLGLFCRYFNQFNPRARYLSDSAYWTFLLHQPVLLLLALPMYDWAVAAEVKFLIVSVGTFVLCTISYHFWVRDTAVGVLLNGRRYARRLPRGYNTAQVHQYP